MYPPFYKIFPHDRAWFIEETLSTKGNFNKDAQQDKLSRDHLASAIPLRSRGGPQWRLRNINNEKIAIKRAGIRRESRFGSDSGRRTRFRMRDDASMLKASRNKTPETRSKWEIRDGHPTIGDVSAI